MNTAPTLRVEKARHCLYEIRTEKHSVIAECYSQDDNKARSTAHALAAAYDLRDALARLVETVRREMPEIEHGADNAGALFQARAALARATSQDNVSSH